MRPHRVRERLAGLHVDDHLLERFRQTAVLSQILRDLEAVNQRHRRVDERSELSREHRQGLRLGSPAELDASSLRRRLHPLRDELASYERALGLVEGDCLHDALAELPVDRVRAICPTVHGLPRVFLVTLEPRTSYGRPAASRRPRR